MLEQTEELLILKRKIDRLREEIKKQEDFILKFSTKLGKCNKLGGLDQQYMDNLRADINVQESFCHGLKTALSILEDKNG